MTASLEITPIKGRPMLHWVGKKPLDLVRHYPAQVCEGVGVRNPPAEPSWEDFIESGTNLLFHGDNKEVLSSLLVAGFRGRVDLIYIDPPFDSGADYVRKVRLRGETGTLEGRGHTLLERVQYEDIWANDNYLQFMYERLILMRELLSDRGNIYLHCDWHKSHHLRFLLDEVFGAENFVNEVIWHYKRWTAPSDNFQALHDSIFWYAKNKTSRIYNTVWVVPANVEKGRKENYQEDEEGRLYRWQTANGERYKIYRDQKGVQAGDVWEIAFVHPSGQERKDFPTQKPEALLERIIKASSHEDSIVLDCFCGSGTAAAVAERLGRRWIMADINKGAIQTTMKRLQGVIGEKNGDFLEKGRGFVHYRVNDYDAANHNDLKRVILSRYGVQTDAKDLFFDGTTADGLLAKIVDLNRPLTRLDVQIVKDEITDNRPDETRDICVFCNGSELGIIEELDREKSPINRISICDVQQEGVITNRPAEAEVEIERSGAKARIRILDYISPSILARMEIDRTVFDERIDDFRAQIDCVLIDADYDGECYKIAESDLPKRRTDFIKGEYELELPRTDAKVAVKIVDMLGEEVLVVESGDS